jgi:GntR family transcriptional repressor for pyruvate dehydrogenase complex
LYYYLNEVPSDIGEKIVSNSDSLDSQPLVFQQLDRKNAYEEVREKLREEILRHQDESLPYRLPTERDLAEQFGVSRMVVREAIRGLEGAGLLSVKKGPRGGIFVEGEFGRPVTGSIMNLLQGGTAGLGDLFEFRLLVEPYAASRAAQLATESELSNLSTFLQDCEAHDEKAAELRSHNIDFHRAILRMTHNPVIAVLGDSVFKAMNDDIKEVVSEPTTLAALDMHKKICQAIGRGDSVEAEALMREDIQSTRDQLSRFELSAADD